MQGSFFSSEQIIELSQGAGQSLRYYPQVFQNEADGWLQALTVQTQWQQDRLNIAGVDRAVPRLQALYSDQQIAYSYSGLVLIPHPLTDLLRLIKAQIEDQCAHYFDTVLINCYRDHNDSVSWHADDEPELGPSPVVASLSLGSTRIFQLKPKSGGKIKHLELHHGDLLLMEHGVQRHWLHQIPKDSSTKDPRINLTFRSLAKNL